MWINKLCFDWKTIGRFAVGGLLIIAPHFLNKKWVASDFLDAQLQQEIRLHQLIFEVTGELKSPPESPLDIENYKRMEQDMQDMCELYNKEDFRKLLTVQYDALGRWHTVCAG